MKNGNLINKKVVSAGLSVCLLLGSLGNINCFADTDELLGDSNYSYSSQESNEPVEFNSKRFTYSIVKEADGIPMGKCL